MRKIITLLIASAYIGSAFSQNQQSSESEFDKVEVIYDAGLGKASRYPPYEVPQNGYIIFEIKDINLFRYSVTLTELQNNVINSTKLSEGNTQISIDPTVFNLNEISLNLQVLPVTTNEDTKALAEIQKRRTDKEVEIGRKEKEMQMRESEYLAALSRLDIVNQIERDLIRVDAELNSLPSDSDLSKEQRNRKDELIKSKMDYTIQKNQQNAVSNIETDRNLIRTYNETTKPALQGDLNKLKDELSGIEYEYVKKVLEDSTSNTRYRNFNVALSAYRESLNKINELTDLYQRLVSILFSDQSFMKIQTERDKAVRDVFKLEEISADDILKHSYRRLRDIGVRFEQLSEAYSLVSGISDNRAKEIFDKVAAFHSQIKTSSYHSFFLQISKVYDAINESNFTLKYQTLILSDNADLVNFNLKAEPHANLPSSVETKPINFNYDVKIRGGVKIDVSTGFFWNFGLNDYAYRFESIDDNTTRVVREVNKSLFVPAFGILFNVYPRSSSDLKFGGNVGFSTNADKLNYYLGASLLIGKSERLNVNFGLAAAQVQMASDLYDTEESLQVPIADLPNEVPLRNPSPFRVGLYFGVTFNLLGAKNKETLSQISTL